MKKAMLTFLALVLTLVLSLGTVAMAETADPQPGDYMNGKVINMRFLKTGERINNLLQEDFEYSFGVKMDTFETTDAGIDTLLLSLQTGKIDGLMTWSFEADYFAKMNPDYMAVDIGFVAYLTASMAIRSDLENIDEVYDMIDNTIAEMWADGTLDALKDRYVTNLTEEIQNESIVIPHTDGAPTYRVVVTGWAVPLDYYDASGEPAGYDAAMLAEIAKRRNINFEVVMYEPNSGLMAVGSGKADFVFCYTAQYDDEESSNEDYGYAYPLNGSGTLYTTRPYFRATDIKLLVKK